MKRYLLLLPLIFFVGWSGSDKSKDFYLDVAAKKIPGVTSVNKFGRAPSGIQTTKTDVWDRANATPDQSVWLAPTAARSHLIVSSSATDSVDLTGAKTIRVYGLPTWSSDETYVDVDLSGSTGVSVSGALSTAVIIHRMQVTDMGVGGPNVGTITATAGVDNTITAQINPGEGQTQMAIYGIPSTKTAYLTGYYATVNKAQAVPAALNVSLLVNPNPDDQTVAFVTKHTYGIQSDGSGEAYPFFRPYRAIQGPAIIKVSATANTNDVEASGGFDLILQDNT